jgi:hypothetical protein
VTQDEALAELQKKTFAEIHLESARVWALRAWAAYQLSSKAAQEGDQPTALQLFHDASDYSHEAIEHAALSEQPGAVEDIRAIVRGAASELLRAS